MRSQMCINKVNRGNLIDEIHIHTHPSIFFSTSRNSSVFNTVFVIDWVEHKDTLEHDKQINIHESR